MAVPTDTPSVAENATVPSTNAPHTNGTSPISSKLTPPKSLIDTSSSNAVDNTADFSGDISTNNDLPSQETLRRIENMILLDRDGRTLPFRSLYSGPNVARRVMVIFIRHFFCGNCQEYLRTLASSITADDLLSLEPPTFIAVVGCGSPSLIPMYQQVTQCPFPIYADPTKKLYDELGMTKTLELGPRPEYQRRSTVLGVLQSIGQSLKHIKGGQAFQGGGYQQVGGEFLFEPVNVVTPIDSPATGFKDMGDVGGILGDGLAREDGFEEKKVSWCHRMRNTRDHAEIPELREVLGFEDEGIPGKDKKRWSKAVGDRKGTGTSSIANANAKLGSLSEERMRGAKNQRHSTSSENLMGTPSVV